MSINWETSKEDAALIEQIADRWINNCVEDGAPITTRSTLMDLTATHANGCPLDLERLLKADADTFAHDLYGIYLTMCVKSGKLQNGFLPKCALKEGIN